MRYRWMARLSLSAVLSIAFWSCGGRGWPTGLDWSGSGTPSPNRAPVASAGPDQNVVVGAAVQLTGSGSSDADGDVLSYRWTPPDGSSLDSLTAVGPRYVATAAGTYRFVLVVNDGTVDSTPDEVLVTVSDASGRSGSGRTLTADLPGGATMEFVWIEPGSFAMGSPSSESGRRDNEGPQHQVTLTKGYWLGQCEVTQGQWRAVMGTTPWSGQAYVQASPSHPAVWITYEDAQALVQQLNQVAGDALYRLPTEAEWEYACRAGAATVWSFGDDQNQLGQYAWYAGNTAEAALPWAQPVGTRLANPWGLCDMHGNVWEWTLDGYAGYSSEAQTDPQGPLTGVKRIVRGGSFDTYAKGTRAAFRYDLGLGNRRNGSIGVRLLRVR